MKSMEKIHGRRSEPTQPRNMKRKEGFVVNLEPTAAKDIGGTFTKKEAAGKDVGTGLWGPSTIERKAV